MINAIEERKRKIEILSAEISEIQEQCSHPGAALEEIHGGSTGNWSRSDDCYWTDYHCRLCDKKWRTIRVIPSCVPPKEA
jgi:hypothetical protein